MVFQIRIVPKNLKNYDVLFEHIQNRFNLYDNCVCSDNAAILIEGHIKAEVEGLLKDIQKDYVSEATSITLEDCPEEDTILDDRREETGRLMVRTANYYEDLLRKIIKIKQILPMLIGMDDYLDTLIEKELKNE